MIANLKSYSATKNSGIGWIGEVPTHWEVTALRNRYEQCLGKMLDAKQGTGEHLMPYLRNVDVQWDRINVVDLPQIDIRPKEVERYTLRRGDLLVCEGGEVGRSAIWMEEIRQCAYQKALHRLRPRHRERDRPRFLLHALRVAVERGAFYDGHESTIGHLTGEKLRAHRFAFPPETDQTEIEAFLDHRNQRIQRYIRAKEKLIGLLEEQKSAIVRDVVTGQIDVRTGRPYATYKRADPDWLGCVPRHWNRVRLKKLLRPVDRRSTTGKETLLSLRRDHGVVIYAEHFTRPPQGATLVGFKHVKAGELVVNRLQANNGLVFCSSLDGLVSPDYSVFERRTSLQMQYLSDLLRTEGYRTHFRQEARGLGTGTAGFLRLYDDAFLRTVVQLPPPAEQGPILQTLESARRKLEALTTNVQRELELMQEFQSCLVANVVTGKLDVRDAMAALSEGNG